MVHSTLTLFNLFAKM